MDEGCKAARKRLKESTRTEYETLVKEAKLTPTQEDILRRHILCGDTVCKISLKGAISQTAQTAAILQNNEAQTANLLARLNPNPIPAYMVQNPNCCAPVNYGCGCGA